MKHYSTNFIENVEQCSFIQVHCCTLYIDGCCRNLKRLLRVGLHWCVPFIEDLSETVQVVWQLVVDQVRSMLRSSPLKGEPGQCLDGRLSGCGLVTNVSPSCRGLMGAHAYYRLGTVNLKSFVSKVLLQIKWNSELIYGL